MLEPTRNTRLRICTVVGARPQFIKAAVVSRAFAAVDIEETLVHSGQHYDDQMSRIFFEQLDISRPAVNLGVGSGRHGQQTGRIMERLEAWLMEREERPDAVLVFGDTNTTLAAALVAAKLTLPIVHVEAGLRSYNRQMPEEVNRVAVDHVSTVLCCPTATAVQQLEREGVRQGVYRTGDVMRDAARLFGKRAEEEFAVEAVVGHSPEGYYLSTVHRAENTDRAERLDRIFEALGRLDHPVIMPLHPRTRNRIDQAGLPSNIHVREPVGYLTMLSLIRHARAVLTDSGGVQKEACWLATPCITLRDETEWQETTEGNWNQIVGADPEAIVSAVEEGPSAEQPPQFGAPPRGDSAGQLIADIVRSVIV